MLHCQQKNAYVDVREFVFVMRSATEYGFEEMLFPSFNEKPKR